MPMSDSGNSRQSSDSGLRQWQQTPYFFILMVLRMGLTKLGQMHYLPSNQRTLGTYGACTGRSRSLWDMDRGCHVNI
ncbi:hypothetical protein HanHA300_Chr05g0173581 [Helianthus annuus]|nr:hypothetical protein HanHA300_Chr05g0173581 [Helianthus annuus]KAJ0576756.1 hypothetical protein HanIR_Chr05g0228051 [Helianthus annuus]KAJ0584378.1 hypothetical protein HanHA89_Chr05g0187871 [Helianthus annuus]